MVLKIKIGGKEKDLDDNGTQDFPIITLFNGQKAYDFCLHDPRSQEYAYYRLTTTQYKKRKDEFAILVITDAKSLANVRVTIAGKKLERIQDINTFFKNLADKAFKDESFNWEILGFSGEYISENDFSNAVRILAGTYSDNAYVRGIIYAAESVVRKKMKEFGFITISLDTSDIDVFVDNQHKGMLGSTIGIPAGSHTVSLRRNNNQIASVNVKVSEGTQTEVLMPLESKGFGSIFSRHSSQKPKPVESVPSVSTSPTSQPISFLPFLLFMATVIWTPLIYQLGFDGIIMVSILMGLSFYWIVQKKKVGVVILGVCYLLALFTGGYYSLLSFVILIIIWYWYKQETSVWKWY